MELIPTDILKLIGLELNPTSLGSFFQLNRRCNLISKDSQFWFLKLDHDFSIYRREPPFYRPDFKGLSDSEQERMRTFLLTLVNDGGDSESSTQDLDEIFTIAEDNVGPLVSLEIRKNFPDPRNQYQRLWIIRWDIELDDYVDKQLKNDQRYLDLLKEIKEIELKYNTVASKLETRVGQVRRSFLLRNFVPEYRENIIPDFERRELPDILKGLVPHPGLIIGIRCSESAPTTQPDYLICFHERIEGTIVPSLSDNRLPRHFYSYLKRVGFTLEEIREKYRVMFPLR